MSEIRQYPTPIDGEWIDASYVSCPGLTGQDDSKRGKQR